MLAMSLASWAHSPNPSQTHWDPLGQREVKLVSAAAPKVLRVRTPSVRIFCWRQNILHLYNYTLTSWHLRVFLCHFSVLPSNATKEKVKVQICDT